MNKSLKIITGSLTFVLSVGAAYFLIPNKVKKAVSENNVIENNEEDGLLPIHFKRFIDTFEKDTGLNENEEKEYYGMHASFENFALSFRKDESSKVNNIAFEGDLDFLMRGLKDINFNLDLDVTYNTRELPLEIGYVDKTLYFGLKDLRMKMGSTSFDELLGDPENDVYGLLYQLFMASKEEGGINFDIEQFFDDKFNSLTDKLFGSLDFSNLAGSFAIGGLEENETGIGLKIEENETSTGYDFSINLEIKKEDEETGDIDDKVINATISVDKEYRLTRIDLGNIDLGNFAIRGAINIECVKNYVVYAPENELYRNYNSNYHYVEIINYRGWLQKFANFLDEDNQKFGVDFTFNLKGENAEIGNITGSINADFSKIIDISNYQTVKTNNVTNNESTTLGEKIRNKSTFGLKVNMFGQGGEEYSNLAVKYVDGQGYINFNEALDDQQNLSSVLKAKIETETMNWIIDELPGMFKDLSDENNTTGALSSLFSFITDSELVKGIKEGDYSVILDVLKNIENNDDGIELSLDLSSLGLGDNASVDLLLDSRTGHNNKILNLDINNLEVGSLEINADIKSDGYQDIEIGEENSYDSLSFLPTVFEQVKGILDTKQAGFAIEGSLLDDDNLGIRLNGQGQFDYGEKFGFGNLTIDQYKYENKGVWYSHKIALDVDNRAGDYAINNARFVYGDLNSDNIKGKVTIQSVLDIVDVIKQFVDDNKDNAKFTKFLAPILKTLSLGAISDIITSKDYLRFAKNDLLKSVARHNDQIDIVIGGSLFEMDHDITIKINLKENKIDSLEAVNIAIKEKTLNLKLSIKDYDTNKVSSLNPQDSYMDLSSISVLLKFGINTTKNNYYHLTAAIDLNALAIINASFDMDVHIFVKDDYVKIYGLIPDAKLVNLIGSAIQDYSLFAKSVKSEFTFETYEQNDPNKEDGIGGYFHIKTTEVRSISGRKFIKHYKTTSKNLIKSENILTYLLDDLLLIKTSVTDKIGDLGGNNSEEKEAGNFANLFTDTGFSYNESKKMWNVGINLNEITGIDALRELELSIYGSNQETLSKLTAHLNIKASLVTIGLGATITLADTAQNVNDWSSSIESSFVAINSVNFPSDKLNNPSAYYEG